MLLSLLFTTCLQLDAKTAAEMEQRRAAILKNMQLVMGPLPKKDRRVPLDMKVHEETKVGKLIRRKISFQSEPAGRVPAYLLLPEKLAGKTPAILCLHQTARLGSGEPVGLGGNPNLHYALHLAERGYITLSPDYPSFGSHNWDFGKHGYESGTMKAIWDNLRAVDLLQAMPEVDPERLGVIGHSLGGHNAMFTAAFDRRLKVIVSSCGFTRFGRDDMPSWTGKVYMPKIASAYKNDAAKMPFDFPDIVASFAPRPFLASACTRDDDFDVKGVKETLETARKAYARFGKESHLAGYYPNAPHDFPADARKTAYEFLDRHLKRNESASLR